MAIGGPAAITEGEKEEYCATPEIDLSKITCGTCIVQTDRGLRTDNCEARISYKWATSAEKDAPELQGKTNERCVTVKGKKPGKFELFCDVFVCCDSEKTKKTEKGGVSQECGRCIGFHPKTTITVNKKK